jgi:ATP-dependent RNA helicase DDX19/DBP5
MPFEDRDRVVNEFRRGETKILISTDVLSRGFDVSQVIHQMWGAGWYDLPSTVCS